MRSIYILGNSPTFINAIKSAYPFTQIFIFAWRDCAKIFEQTQRTTPEILLVCGYDYSGTHLGYDNFYEKNIGNPYRVIQLIAEMNTLVLYINTKAPKNKYTFSRYLFAKNNLGYLLQQNFPKFKNISLPTVIDSKGVPLIYGGTLTKLLFTILIKLKIIESVGAELLKETLISAPNSSKSLVITHIEGRFLDTRRTLFIDRLLRLICG